MATPQKKIVEKETKGLAVVQPSETQVAAAKTSMSQEVVASDTIIPRLLLTQAISPLATSRKAQIGDIVRNLTNEKLGDPEHPVQIVPLSMTSVWMVYERVQGENQPQFRGMHYRGVTKRNSDGQAVETNENDEWKYKGPEGQEMFRQKTVILYALLPDDVYAYRQEFLRALDAGEAPDLNKSVSPVVITFKSTSFKYAGKYTATFFDRLAKMNQELKQMGRPVKAPFDYLLTLKCREEKKGTALWYVFDFEGNKPLDKVFTKETELTAIKNTAAMWVQSLASGAVKTDDLGAPDEEDQVGSSQGTMEV